MSSNASLFSLFLGYKLLRARPACSLSYRSPKTARAIDGQSEVLDSMLDDFFLSGNMKFSLCFLKKKISQT